MEVPPHSWGKRVAEGDFCVTHTRRGGCHVLVLEGELDLAGVPRLDEAMDACSDGLPVIVDMTALEFIDARGLDTVLQERAGGRPAALVRAPDSNLARVLEIVEAKELVPVVDDVTMAVERSC